MEELKDRVKYLRNALKIGSQEKLAEILNVNGARVKSIETGRVKDMTAQEANILVKKFNLNIDWLLTGKGTMWNEESASVVATHNSIAVGHNNSNISINTASFDHGHEIKEIIELLQYAPSAFLGQVKERLLEFKKLSQL